MEVAIIWEFRTVPAQLLFHFAAFPPSESASITIRSRMAHWAARRSCGQVLKRSGQVAQVVERSPEKAGVGGSTPSLATTFQSG